MVRSGGACQPRVGLTSLPRHTFTLSVKARARDGRSARVRRTYQTCPDAKPVIAVPPGPPPTALTLSDLVPGGDRGVAGMRVGGRREVVIPPDLGYGEQGSGPIGPNETLIFVIDLVEVRRG